MLWACKVAKMGVRWKISDGSSVRFWEDWWFGNYSLATCKCLNTLCALFLGIKRGHLSSKKKMVGSGWPIGPRYREEEPSSQGISILFFMFYENGRNGR